MQEFPRRLQHKTPAWVEAGALFHIRVRVHAAQNQPLTAPKLAGALLEAAQRYHGLDRWWCELFLLMPDHLHAMLVFPAELGIGLVMRDWKRGTARFQEVNWQDNFFDHRIRNRKERDETWHYIRRNPVVKGLCSSVELWPWWWSGALEQSGTH